MCCYFDRAVPTTLLRTIANLCKLWITCEACKMQTFVALIFWRCFRSLVYDVKRCHSGTPLQVSKSVPSLIQGILTVFLLRNVQTRKSDEKLLHSIFLFVYVLTRRSWKRGIHNSSDGNWALHALDMLQVHLVDGQVSWTKVSVFLVNQHSSLKQWKWLVAI